MKGFALENGDVKIEKGKICMISGDELIRQSAEAVIGTNKGEWFLNKNEGINFKNILKKNPNLDVIRDEIQSGLNQIDDSFVITHYSNNFEGRTLKIYFKARNASGKEIEGGYDYAE